MFLRDKVPRTGETANLGKDTPCMYEDLGFDPPWSPGKPGTGAYTCDPSAGKTETRIPGTHWSRSLASPRSMRDPVSKEQTDGTWGIMPKDVFWPLYPCANKCLSTHVHVHYTHPHTGMCTGHMHTYMCTGHMYTYMCTARMHTHTQIPKI